VKPCLFAASLLTLVACAGPGARTPPGAGAFLPSAFANAFRVDALGDPSDAVRAHLDVVQAASQRPEDPWQVAALEASLDALATRQMFSLGDAARDAALANRSPEPGPVADKLGHAALRARGQFARGLIARARGAIAQRRGDAAEAERQRAASGCAREAVVIGPIGWAPITGVREVGSLDRPEARIESSYSTGDAFGTAAHPTVVRGRGCSIELSAESARPGVRWVVVDLAVPRAQTVGLVLRAHAAALLRAGGTEVLERPYELGDEDAARFARVALPCGSGPRKRMTRSRSMLLTKTEHRLPYTHPRQGQLRRDAYLPSRRQLHPTRGRTTRASFTPPPRSARTTLELPNEP